MINSNFNTDEKEAIKQILELQPADNIGNLRVIDKICDKIEKDENLEISDINFVKSKINSFSNYNPQKKFRQIIISLVDKIDIILNTKNEK